VVSCLQGREIVSTEVLAGLSSKYADTLQGCMIRNNPARVGEDEEPEKDVDVREQPVNRSGKICLPPRRIFIKLIIFQESAFLVQVSFDSGVNSDL